MAADHLGDANVRLDLQAGGLVSGQDVHAGRGERGHLDVEARIVRRGDPAVADLPEPLPEISKRRSCCQRRLTVWRQPFETVRGWQACSGEADGLENWAAPPAQGVWVSQRASAIPA
jgi:hypothetical protein